MAFTGMKVFHVLFCFLLCGQDPEPSIHDPRFKEYEFLPQMTSWMMIEINSCCVPSELSESTCPGQSSIVLGFPISSSQWLRRRNGCHESLFLFGLGWLSATHLGLFPRRLQIG